MDGAEGITTGERKRVQGDARRVNETIRGRLAGCDGRAAEVCTTLNQNRGSSRWRPSGCGNQRRQGHQMGVQVKWTGLGESEMTYCGSYEYSDEHLPGCTGVFE